MNNITLKNLIVVLALMLISTSLLAINSQNTNNKINKITPHSITLDKIETVGEVVFLIGFTQDMQAVAKYIEILKENNFNNLDLEYAVNIDGLIKFAVNFNLKD